MYTELIHVIHTRIAIIIGLHTVRIPEAISDLNLSFLCHASQVEARHGKARRPPCRPVITSGVVSVYKSVGLDTEHDV